MNDIPKPREQLFGDLWEYSTAPQGSDFVEYRDEYGHFIDGEFVDAQEWFESTNPATEETLARFGVAGKETVDQAVSAARRALEGPWGTMPASERAKYIFRIGRMIK
jgi:aldehyde dehydrogenase (NAD+)